MKLTNRDIKIVSFIENNQGATIEQLYNLFFPSYDMAAKRLKKLADNKFLKVSIQPVLGKKVYYLKKVPSFHTLVINNVAISLENEIQFMQREYKIKNKIVDCIFILKSGKIIVLEVDIYNRTKDSKINEVINALQQTKANIEFWVVSMHKVRKKMKREEVKYIGIEDIKINKVN